MLFLWRVPHETGEGVWSARRPSIDAPFGPPAAVRELESIDQKGPPVKGFCLSSDGMRLSFQTNSYKD